MRPTTFSTSPFEWEYGGGAALKVGKPIDKRALITFAIAVRSAHCHI